MRYPYRSRRFNNFYEYLEEMNKIYLESHRPKRIAIWDEMMNQFSQINDIVDELFNNTLPKHSVLEEEISIDDKMEMRLLVERDGRTYEVHVKEITPPSSDEEDNSDSEEPDTTDFFEP